MEAKLPDWIADHIKRYVDSNGEDGHDWNGLSCLLLTTKGRHTGEDRLLPLIYGKSGEKYIIVASKGGNPHHPSWFLNLVANSHVQLQVGSEKISGNAREAEGEERQELWELMSTIFPTYNDYQAATSRRIPVVVVERQ